MYMETDGEECFFKASKSFMKLGSEFQCRSYSAMVSHTTIVFVRYILLEWIRRNQNDDRSYGELFYMFCDDIQDMDLTNALQKSDGSVCRYSNNVLCKNHRIGEKSSE